MSRPRRPTIADVARRAVVDPAVVSKVLSNDPNLQVREQTRERVRQAAADLGYVPNFTARRLRTGAMAIGLLVPDYRNPGYTEIIAGAEEAAGERGTVLWTASTQGDDPDRYLSLMRSGIVDALLIAGARTGDQLAQLVANGPPILLVNRRSAGIDRWLVLEDERAAEMATDRLIAAGHRRIGFIGGRQDLDTAARRCAGYLTALQRAGIPADPRLRAFGEYTPEGGAQALGDILSASTSVSAFVITHGLAGLGAWDELRRRGYRVPEDISIIGINRMPFEILRQPAMSRVELPLRELGRRAVHLVLDTPPQEPINEVFVGPVALIEGDTIGPPAS